MNEFKPAVIQYCNNFQTGKWRFGEKCKFKHEINLDFKKKKILGDENKDNIHFKKKNSNTSTSQNNITGQHRDVNVEGKLPKYSHQRHTPIHNFNNTNDTFEDHSNNNNNSNWLFSKTSSNNDINPRMYMLKKYADNVDIPDTSDFSWNPETFE